MVVSIIVFFRTNAYYGSCFLSIYELKYIFFVLNLNDSLPDDDLPLAIVDSKYQAMVQAVAGDVMFCHTPKKTIAEVLETKQVCYTSLFVYLLLNNTNQFSYILAVSFNLNKFLLRTKIVWCCAQSLPLILTWDGFTWPTKFVLRKS